MSQEWLVFSFCIGPVWMKKRIQKGKFLIEGNREGAWRSSKAWIRPIVGKTKALYLFVRFFIICLMWPSVDNIKGSLQWWAWPKRAGQQLVSTQSPPPTPLDPLSLYHTLHHPTAGGGTANDYVITLQRHASCSRLGFSHSLVFCMGKGSNVIKLTRSMNIYQCYLQHDNNTEQYDWSKM